MLWGPPDWRMNRTVSPARAVVSAGTNRPVIRTSCTWGSGGAADPAAAPASRANNLDRMGMDGNLAPRRIASLLPAATEILWALGAGDRLVGVSHACDYPREAAALPRLTVTAID